MDNVDRLELSLIRVKEVSVRPPSSFLSLVFLWSSSSFHPSHLHLRAKPLILRDRSPRLFHPLSAPSFERLNQESERSSVTLGSFSSILPSSPSFLRPAPSPTSIPTQLRYLILTLGVLSIPCSLTVPNPHLNRPTLLLLPPIKLSLSSTLRNHPLLFDLQQHPEESSRIPRYCWELL